MPRRPQSPPLIVPLDDWPPQDRQLWETGLRPFDPYDSPDPTPGAGYGAGLSEPTVELSRKSYGRWLAHLRDAGCLDPATHPVDRVTLPRMGAYFDALKAAGNADATILGRFDQLQRALRIMAPERDLRFVTTPNDRSIRSLLPMRKRGLMVPDASVMVDWGQGLIEAAATADSPRQHALLLRDGVLITALASRARRLRAMAGLRLGHELTRRDGRYHVDLPPRLVKMKRRDRFYLPRSLTAALDAYLNHIRPALTGSKRHDAVWVKLNGDPLPACGLTGIVRRRSRKRFGTAFGTHRFRHSIGTTLPLRLPQYPGLAAGVLDVSGGVLEDHYNRAGQAAATASFQAFRARQQEEAIADHQRRLRLRHAHPAPQNPADPTDETHP